MGDDEEKSLVEKAKEASVPKPLVTAIQGMFKAGGVLLGSYKTVPQAKADAEAALIKAQSDIDVADMRRRAEFRRRCEDIREQGALEIIAAKASEELRGKDIPLESKMDADFIDPFIDKAKRASREEMQDWWARMLAHEAQHPGFFSPKTLDIVSTLSKSDAELLRNLCSFRVDGMHNRPLVFDERALIYTRKGINFDALQHLSALGLLTFSATGISATVSKDVPVSHTFIITGVGFSLSLKIPPNREINAGRVLFTKAGQEVSVICEPENVPEFPDYVIGEWKKKGMDCSRVK